MADNVLFEIDASKIIAKLHLAGRKAGGLLHNTDFYVNTGIVDDDPNIDVSLEDPGKVSFDLTNSSSEFQLGYVTTFSYYKSFEVEKTMNSLAMVRSKLFGDGSKIGNKLDHNSKEYKQFESAAAVLSAIATSRLGTPISVDLQTDAGVKELKEQLKKADNKDKEIYDKELNDLKKDVANTLNGYMQTFAGKENMTEQITENSLGMKRISDDIKNSADKRLVKMFEIQEISDQEKAQQDAKFQAIFKKAADTGHIDDKLKNCNEKICFYVTYNLNVDK